MCNDIDINTIKKKLESLNINKFVCEMDKFAQIS